LAQGPAVKSVHVQATHSLSWPLKFLETRLNYNVVCTYCSVIAHVVMYMCHVLCYDIIWHTIVLCFSNVKDNAVVP